MKNTIAQVLEFHKTSGADTAYEPRIPEYKTITLRIALIREELRELEEAMDKGDQVETLDALCDLRYVLDGTILACGMQDVFEEAFDEVHASNMSKFCKNTADARRSAEDYCIKKTDAYYRKNGDLFVILRVDNNKVLKGRNYFKPRLKEILQNFKQKLKDEKRPKLSEVVVP